MKHLKIVILFGLAGLITVGCKEDVIETYHGNDNIYFGTTEDSERELFVGFALTPDRTDSLIKIPLRLMGEPSNSPRTYGVRVDEDNSTAQEGVHFDYAEDEDFAIPSGALVDSLRVLLYKTAEMANDTLRIVFELVESDHLAVDHSSDELDAITGETVSYTTFSVDVTDVLGPPPGWVTTWFGTFSETKFFLMADVLGFDPVIFSDPVPAPTVRYYGITMQRWLDDEADAGRTVYEDDGVTPMEMGPNAQ